MSSVHTSHSHPRRDGFGLVGASRVAPMRGVRGSVRAFRADAQDIPGFAAVVANPLGQDETICLGNRAQYAAQPWGRTSQDRFEDRGAAMERGGDSP